MHRTPVKDLHFAQIRVTENVESTMIKQTVILTLLTTRSATANQQRNADDTNRDVRCLVHDQSQCFPESFTAICLAMCGAISF